MIKFVDQLLNKKKLKGSLEKIRQREDMLEV